MMLGGIWSKRRGFAAAAASATILFSGVASYRSAESARLQAMINETCSRIPSLVAAIDYTFTNWPVNRLPTLTQDVADSAAYFGQAVKSDQAWCGPNAIRSQPEIIAGTLSWNFGNASEALVAYQAATQGIAPSPAAPTPAPAPPAPSPTPTPPTTATGSRENPMPVGTSVALSGGWTVKVVSVTPNANEAVRATNQFNDPPKAGYQFFMTKVEAGYGGEGSARFSGSYRLRSVGAAAVSYSTFANSCGVIPDQLPSNEVFKGGTISGNICWEIRTGDASSLVMYDDNTPSGVQRVYMSLVR